MNGTRAQDLVFTLYGDFLLGRGEPVWVGSLIGMLEPLGLTATNVRTVLSRMAGRCWLRAERVGRRSYYDLTERGRRLLEEGGSRIYDPPRPATWDGEWTLLAYSVPEEKRSQRDRLRVRLSWLGFGSLGNGLWATPHDVRSEAASVAAELEVQDYVQVFRGRHAGFSDARRLVSQLWDLEELSKLYDGFVTRHLSDCLSLKEHGPGSVQPRAAFVCRFKLVHEYRAFALLDPFLPAPLQPRDWPGGCALGLFRHYHDLLASPADRFVDSLLETLALSGAAVP